MTSWAACKSFINHAEKHNLAPEDVAKNGSDEPVKVTHDGSGTHGAGGGGSGGGAVGQGSKQGKSETTGPDVVNGKPHDIPGHGHGHGHDHSPQLSSSAQRSPGMQSQKSDMSDGEKERTVSGPGEQFHDWEMELMEACLAEVRGHLGEIIP